MALDPADLMAAKLLANADRGLERAMHLRDFFDLVTAGLEWPQHAPVAMARAVDAYGASAGTAV